MAQIFTFIKKTMLTLHTYTRDSYVPQSCFIGGLLAPLNDFDGECKLLQSVFFLDSKLAWFRLHEPICWGQKGS